LPELTEQTFYRWRKEYGGLKLEQARKLKELQKENTQLRRAVADLTLEKQIVVLANPDLADKVGLAHPPPVFARPRVFSVARVPFRVVSQPRRTPA